MKKKWRYTINSVLIGGEVNTFHGPDDKIKDLIAKDCQGAPKDFLFSMIDSHKTWETLKVSIRLGAITQELELIEIDGHSAQFIEERIAANGMMYGGLVL